MNECHNDSQVKPLVCFAIFSYNQEEYIEEAIKAALSQTYSPLEIIISDDCSDDDTYIIAKQTIDGYVGSHRVLLRRNEINLGLTGHINKVISLCHGEWIIMAAGDDISFPERADTIMKSISNKNTAFASNYEAVHVDDDDRVRIGMPWKKSFELNLSCLTKHIERCGVGATFAYKISAIKDLLPIPKEVISEDRVLPLQACIHGSMLCLPKPLLKRRMLSSGLRNKAAEIYRGESENRARAALWDTQDTILSNAKKQGYITDKTYRLLQKKMITARSFYMLQQYEGKLNRPPFFRSLYLSWKVLPFNSFIRVVLRGSRKWLLGQLGKW